MARKAHKITMKVEPVASILEPNEQRFKEASGEACKRHSATHRYVDAVGIRRCRQCDEEVSLAEVEKIVRKIKDEKESEAAPPPPFNFITEQNLGSLLGAFKFPSPSLPVTASPNSILVEVIRAWEVQRKEWYRKYTKAPCTEPCRWKLPKERRSMTHHFEIGDKKNGGVSAYITVGMYDNFRVGEIFIRAAKQGDLISGLIDSFAIAVSVELQHGVPLKTVADKFSYQSFEPRGFVQGVPEIKTTSSIVDYCAKWLNLRFPDGYLVDELRGQAVKTRAS